MCPELNFGNFERPPARQRVLACAQALVANVCSSRASQHSEQSGIRELDFSPVQQFHSF